MSDLTGSFDLLRKRLTALAETLRGKTETLNRQRLEVYGRVEPKLQARLAARTENNCVARDVVRVGDNLLFAYNVFIGLKKQTRVEDVFCLYNLGDSEAGAELEPVPSADSFLADQRFVADFRELYTYYRATTLDLLRIVGDKLLMVFRTGNNPGDKRIFRFTMHLDGKVEYIDNRGERDHVLPPAHDFEWLPVSREQFVLGRHPHVNILDTIFVETVGGDLTIKVENNTETGLGIYAEPVDDKNQSLADAEFYYADLRSMIVLKIRPYREEQWRYLVFNRRSSEVVRIDEIGASCLELPEDHGIVFPGGYYLESGEFKHFADLGHDFTGFRLKRQIRAPSGEDVLYVFHEEAGGRYALLPYNLIDRAIGAPLLAHGYARFEDGRMLLFTPELEEPTRIHTMQLWASPFASDEHAAKQARPQGLFGRLGNATLVRGLAELRQLARMAEDANSEGGFDRLIKLATRTTDAYPWVKEEEAGGLNEELSSIHKAANSALQAFERLEQQRGQARQLVAHEAQAVRELISKTEALLWQKPDDFTQAIAALKRRRGELVAVSEQAFVDQPAIEALDLQLRQMQGRVGERAIKFFADPAAFATLKSGLDELSEELEQAPSTAKLAPLGERLDELADSLDGLSELIAGFEQTDAQERASLLQSTGALYAEVNRLRSRLKQRVESLLESEQGLEFGAQVTVFEQALAHQLGRCESPEAVEEGLARALSQIEELEGRFAGQPRFAEELVSRREAALEAFTARREQLTAQREQRSATLKAAITRILDGIPRRVGRLSDGEEIHAFFASDSLVDRARTQIEQLRTQGDAVSADESAARLQSLKEAGLRDARDRADLGSSGNALALGKHRFSIERRTLELVLLHDDDKLVMQLAGTDYRMPLDWPEAEPYRHVWAQSLVSENRAVYRSEYLAAELFERWQHGDPDAVAALRADDDELNAWVAEQAQRRPAEDYQRGVHDADAALIFKALVVQAEMAGALACPTQARILAQALYASKREVERSALRTQAAALHWLSGRSSDPTPLPHTWLSALAELAEQLQIDAADDALAQAARHLIEALGADSAQFPLAGRADDIAKSVKSALPSQLLGCLAEATLPLLERWSLACAWCRSNAETGDTPVRDTVIAEAACTLLFDAPRKRVNVDLDAEISDLRGEHERLRDGKLQISLPEFLGRLSHYRASTRPAFEAFAKQRHQRLAQVQDAMQLEQFQPRPMAGFVRNRLIDEVYLPMVGNNLAKQIGTVGDKRSDRSGMLLLISPPGYGKTTLMEYLADRLGMIFVRVNGPTLGHEVVGLDPLQAPHRAAREELEKLNLGLAMGRNVMLYLDDIQHLSPEFLQKFISLADGTRRIDAVVDGVATSIDLRGKRFCIVMAGNPYTEQGESFRIPDMLANRADTYNLGDVLSGREQLFADSYLENALTAHPLTQPLAERSRDDIRIALRIAGGEDEPLPSSVTSGVEVGELLRRLGTVRNLLMQVNGAYVASAAQDDSYRTEPPFKLQGSYRNMVKLAAQLSPLMTPKEIDSLVRDHYRGEAQTLGARAEENLLKLAHLAGQPSDDEQQRWGSLCEEFRRVLKQGGKDADGITRISGLLADIASQLEKQSSHGREVSEALTALNQLSALQGLVERAPLTVETPAVIGETLQQMAKSYDDTLVPLVSAIHHKLSLDQSIWEHIRHVRTELDGLVGRLQAPNKTVAKPTRTRKSAAKKAAPDDQ